MDNKEKLNIMQMIDDAMNNTAQTTEAQTSPVIGAWANPEEYRAATGKRFRMTKAEVAQHGETVEGRQAAFIARRDAGQLPL